jgi:selenide,water dikinase
MLKTNKVGTQLAELTGVSAITDVTGFGLLGHLTEICEASNVSARIIFDNVPVINGLDWYLEQGSIPGGTGKNFASYGHKISKITDQQKSILCDPQTSGGLLLVVSKDSSAEFKSVCKQHDLVLESFGVIEEKGVNVIEVV